MPAGVRPDRMDNSQRATSQQDNYGQQPIEYFRTARGKDFVLNTKEGYLFEVMDITIALTLSWSTCTEMPHYVP